LPNLPFSQSYWVIPGVFLAGEHPAAAGDHTIKKRLDALIQAGISVFVDLTEVNHLHYDKMLMEEAEGYVLEVAYKNFPIRDFTAPAAKTVKKVLDYLDFVIAGHKMVYVHCFGGIGRTGTIVGCYLVRHGLDGRAALAKIAELRMGLSANHMRSPEADDQVERVLNWRVGQ